MISQLPRYITPIAAQQSESNIHIRAVALHDKSTQRVVVDVLLPNNGTPCKPRLINVIHEHCGPDWSLGGWVVTDCEF